VPQSNRPIPAFDDAVPLDRAWRQNRLIASAMLVVAAAIFAATGAAAGFWPSLAHAGAEAALVGGLADWFAVTALFRHPLGLPIPRTAIIPANKDRIGAGLGSFIERNFLAPEILAARLRALAPVRHAADWLAAPDHARLVAARVSASLAPIVRALEDQALRDFVARSFHEQLSDAELAPSLGRVLALLTRGGAADALFDRALDAAQEALAANQGRLFAIVAERSRWWVPRAIDRRIAEQIVAAIEEWLGELRLEESDARRRCRAAILALADDLVQSPLWRARVAAIKTQILAQPEVQDWLGAIWDELRRLVLDDLVATNSRTHAALAAGLVSLARTLAADPAMQERLHAGLEHTALAVVPWRGQIAALVAEVVRGWDAGTVAARLERALGSDLQYIRMSGTLVGAGVGCVLFLVARFAF